MNKTTIMSGNELIVQGGLEAGFNLYTGYPGSPLADYFNILHEKKSEIENLGARVVIGNSEANAAAMASGAKQAGKNVCVAMKSMGLHVASDALSVGNFADPGDKKICPYSGEVISSGVVVVVGDDPWSQSTSTPADSRFLFKHLHMPFLEPSTPQELKDWMKVALEISSYSSVYQGIILNTFMAEGGGRVELGEIKALNSELIELDPSSFDLSKNVMVPPNSLIADERMLKKRFPRAIKKINELRLDQIFGSSEAKVGIVSSGVVFESVKEVLEKEDLLNSISLYKVACSYPLSDDRLIAWLQSKEIIIVIEEKRAFLETEIRHLLSENKIQNKLWGKSFDQADGFPSHGGINVEIIRERLKFAFEQIHFTGEICQKDKYENVQGMPHRLPTFCPGCPHRETLSLLKEIRKDLEKSGIKLISHGDVGCYSLSFLEPFKEMHNLSAMGQGGALGAGVDLFTKNPSVVLMGDSTFFHSGLTDISNSVQTGHNITYILLDNDNTAMTGHQMTPASGFSVEGKSRPRQKMVEVVKTLGVDFAFEVNPSDRYFYKNELMQTIQKSGVKVIVSNKECGLTFHGREKRKEREQLKKGVISNKTFFQINSDLCENCHACVEMTGCPGLTKTSDAYGDKIMIDPQICVADSYCTKIKACPSFEEVVVQKYHPTKYKIQNGQISVNQIPEVEGISLKELTEKNNSWRAVVTGVGGSGVTTISRILAEAAKDLSPEFDFKFMDQKGLAQRNGRVTGHLALHKKGTSAATVTPMGEANLLISPDLLDGSQALQFLDTHLGVGIIGDDFQIPLSFLLQEDAPDRNQITDLLKRHSFVELVNLKNVVVHQLGKAVYANAMALGVAYQKGLLPFSLFEMTNAFERAVPKLELQNNIAAFNLGRLFVFDSENVIFSKTEKKIDLKLFSQSVEESFPFYKSTEVMVKFFEKTVNRLIGYFPTVELEFLYQYIHDQFIYGRGKNIEDFMQNAGLIANSNFANEHKKLALRILSKTYFIKDEVFCSHQMISPLKKYRDQNNWGVLGKGYLINRINRPHFDIFGMAIEFDMSPSTWMLKLMRHFRFLRVILPMWHYKEKQINTKVRSTLMDYVSINKVELFNLKKLDSICGYREVRYQKFDEAFHE